jgi:hypothetical protein
LAESLVHEIGIASRQVRAEHWALAKAEYLDEESKADGDLFSAGPSGDLNRVARKSCNPVSSVLRKGDPGENMVGDEKYQPRDKTKLPAFPSHQSNPSSVALSHTPPSYQSPLISFMEGSLFAGGFRPTGILVT